MDDTATGTKPGSDMAKNGAKGGGRSGMVRGRSQSANPKTGLYTKRDTTSGRFLDVRTSGGPFKGVKKEG